MSMTVTNSQVARQTALAVMGGALLGEVVGVYFGCGPELWKTTSLAVAGVVIALNLLSADVMKQNKNPPLAARVLAGVTLVANAGVASIPIVAAFAIGYVYEAEDLGITHARSTFKASVQS